MIARDYHGQIVINTPAKGSVNPVGMYKIDAAGNITDVKILWNGGVTNSKGSGSAPTVTVVDVDVKAGEKYGFFILSNGYGTNSGNKLLSDTNCKWDLRDEYGGSGQIGDKGLRLWHVDSTGKATAVSTSADHKVYHSIGTAASGYMPNSDGLQHALSTVDYLQGVVTIGLESGGKPDFADAVIKFCLGTNNALALNADTPVGKGSADWLNGGDGNDKVLGLAGNDVVVGGNGSDHLYGNSGDDTVSGGNDNDDARGGKNNDVVSGGQGDDTVYGNTGHDVLAGDEGNDSIIGGMGGDTLADGDGSDKADGGTGNDVIYAGEGNDLYVGGEGRDTLNFSLAGASVHADLDANIATGAGTDTLDGIENLTGSAWGDVLVGDKEVNVIRGGLGHDFIMGKRGSDVLSGGGGSDTFSYQSRKDAVGETYTDHFVDQIEDFSAGDKLDFSGFKLDMKNGITGAVSVVEEADGSHLFAKFGTMGMVEIAVLEGVSGFDVAAHYADATLLV
jgi:Ca2+-binding RTX toxin-like protein